jgi:2-keto-4-pentenoate hydratase
MITPAQRELARLLAQARRTGRQIEDMPQHLVPATPADGYAVNALVADIIGWRRLGWKVAGTNPDMMRRLRVSEPIYGRSFAQFEVASPATLAHASLLDPIVECEFFFYLGRDLPARSEAYGEPEVAASVARVHAGIEVAECRFPLGDLPPIPAILADGAANGRYVVGPEIEDWRQRDLAAMQVTLAVDGKVRRSGSGSEVMGDPLRVVTWLANARSRSGDGLRAGEMISSGTCTGMLLALAGQSMEARFGDLLPVEVTFTA